MQLADLLSEEEWIKLEEDIHRRFGMDTNVFNTKGIRITPFKSWVNELCPEIKATDKGQSFICAVAHMNLATIAQNTHKTVVEECDAGIAKIVVPIFVNDEFMGAVGACGKVMPDGEVDSFLVNKITEIDEEKVEQLSIGVEQISSQEISELVDYVEKRIAEIIREYEV